MEREAFDFVVTGAGSAGCAVAARLSEDGRYRVLLLEAGKRDSYPWIHIPIGFHKLYTHDTYNWRFESEPVAGLNGRTSYQPRGKMLGGTSSLNGMVYMRGTPADYDGWRQRGCAGWDYASVLPYFRKAEDQERGADEFHGVGGPLKVSDQRFTNEIIDAVIEAAVQAGIPRNSDFNGATQEGVGYYQGTIGNGRRWSAATAYLKPARSRKNLVVMPEAHATRLLIENGRASRHRVPHAARVADRTLPRRDRGRGRRLRLAAAADAVRHRARRASEGHGHRRAARSSGRGQPARPFQLVHRLEGEEGRHAQRSRALAGREGQGRHPVSRSDGRGRSPGPARSPASSCAPTLASIDPTCSSTSRSIPSSGGTATASFPTRWPGFMITPVHLQPEGRGRVSLKSPDPLAPPKIEFKFLETAYDVEAMLFGARLCRKIAEQPALRPYVGEEIVPGPSVTSEKDLIDDLRNRGVSNLHPVGTCRMGTGSDAVVDPRLKVHGIAGLRVADASIMPQVVGGNTNAPSIMIGEKCAAMMLEDARRQ